MRIRAFIGLLAVLSKCNSSVHEVNLNTPEFVIPQGIIELDSEFAKKIGFISSRFLSCSYLWGEGNRIIISTIECTDRRRGYLRELFRAIWDLGAEIVVRTPLGTMEQILIHYSFKKTIVQDPIYGKADLWVR